MRLPRWLATIRDEAAGLVLDTLILALKFFALLAIAFLLYVVIKLVAGGSVNLSW